MAVGRAAPDVTVELIEIDPSQVRELPLDAQVHGRIRYATETPVRIVLIPYLNGQPVEDGVYLSGSPDYPAGAGEAHAWFAFGSAQAIDEIRAVANDSFGEELASASLRQTVAWRDGASAAPVADWVAPLQKSTDELSQAQQRADGRSGLLIAVLMQLVFSCIPLSVAVQIFSLCKLEGRLKSLARYSAYGMAGLWIFVLATALAGSHLSPLWLAYMSPVFLLFLAALLVARSRFRRGYAATVSLKQV
jgi:hypothetical protein